MKADTSLNRVKAFVKRLIQVSGLNTVPFICGSLFLVGDIARMKPGIWSLVSQPEEFEDEGENAMYDGKKRDPLYCQAELSCLWELVSIIPCFIILMELILYNFC
jgi:ribosome biogenesis protein MAK21